MAETPRRRAGTTAIPWSGGAVLAGRSLRLVEENVDRVGLLTGAAWLATLAALALAAGVVASLWPKFAARG